tara:strand:- start:406 stop:2136 length:1731 start_codon:yes stop_codon:yes gene_type:complete
MAANVKQARFEILGKDKTAAAISSARKRLNQLGQTFAAFSAASAAAIGAVVAKSSTEIDKLAKTSERLGIPIEKLQALHRMAELSGVRVNTLNMAMQRMTRRVSEAANGTGEAQNALAELGLDAERLAALSPDQQFKLISEAMAGVANQGDRVRLAMRLFDSEGVALVNTMALGADAIDKVGERLRQLGVTLSETDAGKVEAANDAFSEMAAAVQGAANRLTVELAPIIIEVSKLLTDAMANQKGFTNAIQTGVQIAIAGFAAVGNVIRGWQAIIKTGEIAILGLFEIIATISSKVVSAITVTIGKAIAAIDKLIIEANRKFGTDIDTVNGIGLSKFQKFYADVADTATTARKQAQAELMELATTPLPTETVDEWFANITDKANAITTGGGGTTEAPGTTEGATSGGVVEQITQLEGKILETETATKKLASTTDKFFEDMSRGLSSGISSWRDLGQVALSSLSNILLGSQQLGGGGGVGTPGFLGSLFSFLPGFATGGSFTVGGGGGTDSQLVAFRATPGERVDVRTPAQQQGGGDYITINQTIQQQPGQDPKALADMVAQLAVRAVSETSKRRPA